MTFQNQLCGSFDITYLCRLLVLHLRSDSTKIKGSLLVSKRRAINYSGSLICWSGSALLIKLKRWEFAHDIGIFFRNLGSILCGFRPENFTKSYQKTNRRLHATLTALFGKNKFISNGRNNPFSLQSIIMVY